MLAELHVAGLGVIEEASLEFAPGLNVLTGETGAGKTLVTVALSLAVGARAASELVRDGETGLAVEARFSLGPPPQDDEEAPASAFEFAEDGELILARSIRPDGRGTARAGGHLVPVSSLAVVAADLVEVHGQHQAERLLEAGAQTEFLDRFAGPGHQEVLGAYRRSHGALRDVRRRLDALDREARERERDKDLLAYQVSEIQGAGLSPGESAGLAEEESRLAHAERILGLAGGADLALGGDGGAADRLREAWAALDASAGLDSASEALASRTAALVAEADDVLAGLRAYRDRVEVDPARLEGVRERVQAIRALERKYGEGEEGILAYLAEARERLAGLEVAEGEREALEAEVARLSSESDALSLDVGKARAAAAPALSEAVTRELRELGMPGGRVDVTLEQMGEPGPDGAERAAFVFSGGPGQRARPFAKVASGGELSRTMLACRSVLSDLDDVQTLVFDEVDAGIGGRAAAAVGRRLAQLAGARQILVVTHLAQIAVHAGRHFVVSKAGGTAEVRALADGERPAELARMLSGSVNAVSLAHARELLDAARGATADAGTPRRRAGRPA